MKAADVVYQASERYGPNRKQASGMALGEHNPPDNNRGRDGHAYQAEHFYAVLHDERHGWVHVSGGQPLRKHEP